MNLNHFHHKFDVELLRYHIIITTMVNIKSNNNNDNNNKSTDDKYNDDIFIILMKMRSYHCLVIHPFSLFSEFPEVFILCIISALS